MKFIAFLLPPLFLLISFTSVYSQNLTDTVWKKTPSPFSSTIRSFAEGPNNALYIGSLAGVYKSTDKGKTWNINGLKDHVIDALLVTKKGTLLAGTYRAGIYRSEDDGKSWSVVGLDKNIYVFNIIETKDNIIFATGSFIIDGLPDSISTGVFKSMDDGKTWAKTIIKDSDIVTLCNPKPGLLFAGSKSKLYRSTNNGLSWERCGKGLPDSIPVSSITRFNKTLFASLGHKESVIIKSGGGIFRSEDEGISWIRCDNGIDKTTRVTSIIHDRNNLYAGAGFFNGTGQQGIFKSCDKGKTWKFTGVDEQVRFLNKASGNLIIAGTEGASLFISNDQGSTWTQTGQGIDNWVTLKIRKNKNTLFVIGGESGIYRSTDQGINWIRIRKNYSDLLILSERQLLIHNNNQILTSYDNGDTWSKQGELKGTLVFLHKLNDTLIAACTDNGLFYSNDKGLTWNQYNIPGKNNDNYRTIIQLPNGTIFTGFRTPKAVGILRSVDNGKTWEKVAGGLHAWTFCYNEGTLYVGNYGMGIYKTLDLGETWIECNNGLTINDEYITITSITVAPDQSILCSTLGKGIFKSTDQGKTWSSYNSSLTNLNTWDIFVFDNETLITTSFNGLFQRKLNK